MNAENRKKPAVDNHDAPPFTREDVILDGAHFSVLKGPGDVTDLSRPFVLFSHANGFNAQTYRHLFAPLTDKFTIWMWDMRGHGFTSAPALPEKLRSWRRFRNDMMNLLDLINRPVFLCGHSLGGMSSFLTAVQRPDQVKAVLALDPVTMPISVSFLMTAFRHGSPILKNPMVVQAKGRRATFASVGDVIETYRGRGAFKTWPDNMLEDYARGGLVEDEGGVRLACEPYWEAAIYRTVVRFFTLQSERLQCPVSILAASKGSTIAPASRRAFQRNLPKLTLREIEGSTHFLPMEFPDDVRAALETLIEGA